MQEQKQTACFWPAGAAIKKMNSTGCKEVLASFGVEGPKIDQLGRRQLRNLVEDLKRLSHLDHSCECPARTDHPRPDRRPKQPRPNPGPVRRDVNAPTRPTQGK